MNKFKVGDTVKFVGKYDKLQRIEKELKEKGSAKILSITNEEEDGLWLSLEGIDHNITHGFYYNDLEVIK